MDAIQRERLDFRLNGNQIKLIAIVTMFIDHIGAFLLSTDSQWYPICRSIGRLAFPIFCWMIVEGAVHTRSVPKYATRLAMFAVISTPPYNLVHGEAWYSMNNLNVFFTLLFGLAAIASIQNLAPWIYTKLSKFSLAESKSACVLLGAPFCIILYFVAYLLNTDYGGYGVATVLLFYLLRERQSMAWICFALMSFIHSDLFFVIPPEAAGMSRTLVNMHPYGIITNRVWEKDFEVMFYNARQPLAAFACLPIALYNGQRGKSSTAWKYFFYLFYPIHLMLIWCIQLIIK